MRHRSNGNSGNENTLARATLDASEHINVTVKILTETHLIGSLIFLFLFSSDELGSTELRNILNNFEYTSLFAINGLNCTNLPSLESVVHISSRNKILRRVSSVTRAIVH